MNLQAMQPLPMSHSIWIKNMKLFCSKTLSVILFCGLSYSCFATLGLNIKPLTNTDIRVPQKEHRKVQYMVQNTSSKTQTYLIENIPGAIVLYEEPNHCKTKITLESGQSCVLSLQLSALNVSYQGPKFCNKDSNQCIEPKHHEKISVKSLPAGAPTIDLKVGPINPDLKFSTRKARTCKSHYKKKTLTLNDNHQYADYDDACNLEIFAGVDYYTGIAVINTSTIPIYIYTPTPLDPNLDTTFESSCTNYNQNNPLHPGDLCAYYYKAPASTSTPQIYTYFLAFPVNNTHNLYIDVVYSTQVFNIGDYYPNSSGEQIFQLPTEEPGTGIYVMHTVANNVNEPASQNDAYYYCTGLETLPTIDLLTTLQTLSTCGGTGVISGFDCNQIYWSENTAPSIARDFQTSSNINPASPNTEYPSRCINTYFFAP